MIGYIYCLKSRNGRIIYVGQTVNDLRSRLNQHFGARNQGTGINRYFQTAKNLPTIHLLEKISFRKKDSLYAAESKWVKYLRSRGYKLLNTSNYGLFVTNRKGEPFINNGKCPVCGNRHIVKIKFNAI